MSVSAQYRVLSLNRSNFYYIPTGESEVNLAIMRQLDKQYFKTPFYGALRLTEILRLTGYKVNIKRVRHLMKIVNWQTIYRELSTTINDKTHYKYPYLLRGLKIERCNQVWAMDITYIPMKNGFVYLTAIIDLHSRYVVEWSLSNTMKALPNISGKYLDRRNRHDNYQKNITTFALGQPLLLRW
jgi:putative transposase